MGAVDLAFQGVSAVVSLIALTFFVSKARRAKRSFWNRGVSKLSEGTDRSMGKFVGYVDYLDDPMRAPVSGRRCAFYEARAAVVQVGFDQPQTVVARDWCEFWLDDGTAKVRVRLSPSATVALMFKIARSGKKAKHIDAWGETVAFIEREGGTPPTKASIKTYSLKEACLEAGERIAIRGRFTLEPDPNPLAEQALYRSSRMRAVLEVPSGHDCYVTDNPQLLEPLGVVADPT